MAVEERRRHQLYEGLVDVLGPEATATMMELLPPSGEEQVVRSDIAAVTSDIAAIRSDIAAVRSDVAAVKSDVDHLERHIDDRIERLRGELLAAFRGELVTAVSGQTRAVIVATATATFGIGGLAVTLAQLL